MSETITAYDKRAHHYETKWEDYLNHTHREFIRRITTTESDTILDVSGGSGLLAKMVIDNEFPFKHYIVNDRSTQMLNIAKDRLSEDKKNQFYKLQS